MILNDTVINHIVTLHGYGNDSNGNVQVPGETNDDHWVRFSDRMGYTTRSLVKIRI